jgi:hypothetical protein
MNYTRDLTFSAIANIAVTKELSRMKKKKEASSLLMH